MAIDGRIRELGSRHENLDRAIQEELRHPSADSLHVRQLKTQKLRVKGQLEVLRGARAH